MMFSTQRTTVKNFPNQVSVCFEDRSSRGTYQSGYHEVVIDLPFQSSNPSSHESQEHRHTGNDNEHYADGLDQRTPIFVLMSELIMQILRGWRSGHLFACLGIAIDFGSNPSKFNVNCNRRDAAGCFCLAQNPRRKAGPVFAHIDIDTSRRRRDPRSASRATTWVENESGSTPHRFQIGCSHQSNLKNRTNISKR